MLLFYVTFPDHESAHKVCEPLVTSKLIACYNLHDMQSGYVWEGKFCQENEVVAILKTTPNRSTEVEQAIAKAHPYEVPCIMQYPVKANAAYETWVLEQVSNG